MRNDTDILQLTDEAIQAEICKKSFYEFVKEFWDTIIPEPLVDNWHIKYLCDEAQKVAENVIARKPKEYDLIINISPGSTKSTIFSVMLPAYLWARDPSIQTIAGSHASSLATSLSVKSRDIIQSDKYRNYFDVKIKDDSNNKTAFKTTEGGARVSTSVGSSAIGQHAHVIIVDDPLSVNPSDAEIKTANNWITNELATRKVNKDQTPTILIMQRLAEDDPTNHMLEKAKDVKHICLPAELTDDVHPKELTQYYEDGLMDPVRLSREVLKDMEQRLGSFGYASQFLQTPQPLEGGIIKEHWIQYADELPEGLEDEPTYFFLDTAYTNNEGNDPSGVIAAKSKGNILYVLNATEVWKEFPQLIEYLGKYFDQFGYENRSKVYIEPKASGKSIAQYLQRETRYNVIEDKPPHESKDIRLQSIAPKVEAKKVYLLKGAWNDNFVQQLTHAKPRRDDMRDAFIMAVRKLLIENIKGRIAWR